VNTNNIDCVKVGAIETNCWLYSPEEEGEDRFCFVIDPGDEADLIVSRLKELNWIPRYILLTHGHFDHLTALPALLKAFKEGVFGARDKPKVGVHRAEAQWKSIKGADILFEEGDPLPPFKGLRVPGHTPGSAAFYDEGAGILFSGDTLFRGDWGRTDLPGGSEALIQQSLERLRSMKEEIIVCPGHGPVTTIGEEKRNY
jgi:glyoxylase-like metal-dependent hydrolase (beta-lactamase superfamily II)